jgi:superfamily II DNA or RNA helicase
MKLTYLDEKIKIEADSNQELRGIKKWFNRYVENYMFSPLFKNKLWNGKRSRFNDEESTVPMGLWQEIYKCANDFGYDIQFTNKKEFPLNRTINKKKFEKFIIDFYDGYTYKDEDFKARPYQIRVAYNILKNRYCNIAVATSGGKTFIYALVFFYLLKENRDRKFLLIVPSKTLVTQFYDDLLAFDWKNELDINVKEIYGVEEKPRIVYEDKEINLYIGTFQSLSNAKLYPAKWFKQFYMVTTDEGHRSKSESYKKILNKTMKSATYRWGMSGSFPVSSTYEMMEIMAKTGPVVDTVTARELMDAGYITQVKIKSILLHHNDWEFTDLLSIVSRRDRKAAYDLEVERIQESPERLVLINDIVSKCKSNTLVLFHNTDYGHKLLEYLQEQNSGFIFHYIDGKITNKKRKPIIADMEVTAKTIAPVEYTILNFGDFEIEVRSSFKIKLTNGALKFACDITTNDDVDDEFILSIKDKFKH